jgi:hypothetical protein
MNPLKPKTASDIFARMPSRGTPTTRGIILTNKPLSKKLRQRCGPPASANGAQETYELTSRQRLVGVIIHDGRSVADVKQSLLQRIQALRRDRLLGQGIRSAGLLMAVLLDKIFDSAAGMSARTISADEILRLLSTKDNELAHTLREYDWGVPLLEVPRLVSPVPRTTGLAEVTELFNASVAGRTPASSPPSGLPTRRGLSCQVAESELDDRGQYPWRQLVEVSPACGGEPCRVTIGLVHLSVAAEGLGRRREFRPRCQRRLAGRGRRMCFTRAEDKSLSRFLYVGDC